MNWKRIGRALVCLLVVCCLLLNMFPARAQATGVELIVGTAISFAAVYVVASVLIGLGVLPDPTEPGFFDDLVDSVCSFLADAGLVVNGMISIWAISNGNCKYAVDQSLIETIRDWLFAERVLVDAVDPDTVVPAVSFPFSSLPEWNTAVYPYFVIIGNPKLTLPTSYYLFCSEYPLISIGVSPAIYLVNEQRSGMLCCYYAGGTHEWQSWDSGRYTAAKFQNSEDSPNAYEYVAFSSHDIYDKAEALFYPASDYVFENIVVTTEDLTLAHVPSSDEVLAEGYISWAENSIALPNATSEDDKEALPVWPLGLGQTYDDTLSLDQDDVWSGASSYEDSTVDTLTGTLSDTMVGSFIDVLVDALTYPLIWAADRVIAGVEAIFVPKADFLTAKVEALRAEFSFADSIMSAGELVGSTLQSLDTSPPVIYIDLGASRGSYQLGGEVPFIDLRWYAEYKPTVDTLLSALLWIVFIWRLFIKRPGIISGMPGDFVMDGLHQIGLVDRLPARNAAYEVQRISNRQSVRKGPGQ